MRARSRASLGLFAAVFAGGYLLDQVTKALAVQRLVPGESTELLGSFLRLTLVRNPGAAFSFGTGATWVLSIIAAVVSVAVIVYARRLGSTLWAIALGLLLTGALGNLTDRLLRAPGFARGHVVDFLQLPRWPIFNVADSAICVAAVLIVVLAVRGVDVDGGRAGAREAVSEVPVPEGDDGARDR